MLQENLVGDAVEFLGLAGHSFVPTGHKDVALLGKLEDRIFFLRSKGFQFNEISALLEQCGINLLSEAIQDYYYQAQEKRLAACERLISDYYRPEWNAVSERTSIIERGLRQALKDDRGLLLHYQPQVDMHTGDVLGAEALVRWQFNGTLVHPAEFIPVAEGMGLITQIGEWVLREACREAKRWQSLGLGGEQGIKVGVNLSVKQFSETLPDLIHGILCDTGLPTNLLGLEITESFLVGNDSLNMLHSLRNSGIQLSVDDFGIGYSCLAQLKDLPLDTIKIDRTFVQDLGQGGNSTVVETIIDLARKLGVKTLAEGVETMAQSEALRELGCSVCQGFLYSTPLSGDAFIEYVQPIK